MGNEVKTFIVDGKSIYGDYEIALRDAIRMEGKDDPWTYYEIDTANSSNGLVGKNPVRHTDKMYGKRGQNGNCVVEWHNRWCFYYKGENIANHSHRIHYQCQRLALAALKNVFGENEYSM